MTTKQSNRRKLVEIGKKILINWRSLYGLVRRLYLFARVLDRGVRIKIVVLQGLQLGGYVIFMIGSLAIVPFVNYALSPERSLQHPVMARLYEFVTTDTPFNFVLVLAIGSIVLLFFSRMAQVAADYVKLKLELALLLYYQANFFYYYMRQNTLFDAGKDVADIIDIVRRRLPGILTNFINPFLQIIHTLLYLMVGLFVLYLTDPILVFFVILPIGLFLGISMYATRIRIRTLAQKIDQESIKQNSKMLESLLAREYIQILGKENIFARVYRETLEKVQQAHLKIQLMTISFGPAGEVLIYGTLVGVITYILLVLQESDLTTVTVFIVIVYRVLPQANNLFSLYRQMKEGVVYFDASAEDLLSALSQKISYQPHRKNPLPFSRSIRLENISCRYGKGREHPEVLRDIQMKIDCGMKVGICGESGSGKTTLLKILIAMLPPQQGKIWIDDLLFTPQLKRRWQDNLGYVSQNLILLRLSIKENIALASGDEIIDMKRVKEVLRLTASWDFVNALPQGLDSLLSSTDTKLSGGQKQRLVIARSLYSYPQVLILDEATSALDKRTEHKIMRNIHKVMAEQTIIMVTHRLDTIKDSDIIFFMKDGRIAAQGSYKRLMKNREFRFLAGTVDQNSKPTRD